MEGSERDVDSVIKKLDESALIEENQERREENDRPVGDVDMFKTKS